MNEQNPIDALSTERDLPGDRHRQIREQVMTRIDQDLQPARRRVSRRWVLAGAALAVVAAVGAGVVTLAGGAKDPAPEVAAPPMSEVAHIFESAAAHAQAAVFTPPRPDQWLYIEDQSHNTGPISRAKGMRPEVNSRNWFKADGTQWASSENGEPIHVQAVSHDRVTWPKADYPSLVSLPTDPAVLLAKLKADQAASVVGTPIGIGDADAAAYRTIIGLMGNYLPPPDVTAALLRAAALIPGVTQEPVEVEGRQLIALGLLVAQDGVIDQLLLEPGSYAVVGARELYPADATIPFGDSTIEVKKGEVEALSLRLASGVVDNYGDTL
ncbi:hypothetical protein Afil01_47530 [Actinorhabdospora filicis]|uniref:CU044_5270 family protein n=1 Tax=Actinorhabdospora filicis TaxID=1785913 RepID=A0A9W6SSI1_9ACTN|nr:CU044_5270 family protein [Actinorhabdospora filicis]GLZ79946.1 hypothetical protein Afil01_47530 [Actinorhabdospora filicis]